MATLFVTKLRKRSVFAVSVTTLGAYLRLYGFTESTREELADVLIVRGTVALTKGKRSKRHSLALLTTMIKKCFNLAFTNDSSNITSTEPL